MKNEQKQERIQQSLENLRQEEWDVIVIGAGPAGSTAAVHLASLGYQVLLVDKDAFPREKVCGDGLITDALNCLERMGLRELLENKGYSCKSATIFSRSHIQYTINVESFITIQREIFDSILADKAIESGVTFAKGKFNNIKAEKDGSTICFDSGSDKFFRTRAVVMATGTNTDLPRRTGITKIPKPTHAAVRYYVQSSVEIDFPVISYDKSVLPGCAWIFPLGAGRYNIGCCISCHNILRNHINIRKTFKNFMTEFSIARQIAERAKNITPLKAGMLCTSLKGTVPYSESNHVLSIGEAIGTTLPLTGEGIGKAMVSGELAAKVIDEAFRSNKLEHLRTFPELINEKLKPCYSSYEAAEKWLTRFWLNDISALCLKKSKKLRNTLSGVLQDKKEPSEVFSVCGIIKSFLG